VWGAPRIHGELLKLGFEIAESTVSKYMVRHRRPPSQSWRTFLHNHADAIATIDFCVVPTLTFECLFAFLVVGCHSACNFWKPIDTQGGGEALDPRGKEPKIQGVTSVRATRKPKWLSRVTVVTQLR
jgi:hypothetical protein